jgi:thiol-disulfide isomerase/thioredoxin
MKKFLFGCALLVSLAVSAAAQGEPVKLAGQVVCSDCWFEAKDRNRQPYGTAADLKCASDCADKNIPGALAVKSGAGFKLYLLEDGKVRVRGRDWLAYASKQVEVTGTLRRDGESQFLKVDALEVTGESPVARQLAEQAARAVGTQPELLLRDLAGVEQRLSALRGRVVVLNFWATYCEPCRKEMPDLAAVQNDYAALGVQVIGASADEAGDRAKVLQFIKETKVNFPVWTGATAELMPRFGLAPALPGTVVLDREGKIVSSSNAVVNPAELRKQLDALLAAPLKQADATARAAGRKDGRDDDGHGHGAHEEGDGKDSASTVPS